MSDANRECPGGLKSVQKESQPSPPQRPSILHSHGESKRKGFSHPRSWYHGSYLLHQLARLGKAVTITVVVMAEPQGDEVRYLPPHKEHRPCCRKGKGGSSAAPAPQPSVQPWQCLQGLTTQGKAPEKRGAKFLGSVAGLSRALQCS